MTGGLLDLLEKPTSNPRPLSPRVDPKLVNDEFITPAACYSRVPPEVYHLKPWPAMLGTDNRVKAQGA